MSDARLGTKEVNKKKRKTGNDVVDQLRRESGLSTEELKNIMDKSKLWRILVNDVRVWSK